MKDILSKLIFKILKILQDFLNHSPFLPERIKIEKVEKLVANLHDRTKYAIHTRNLIFSQKVYNTQIYMNKLVYLWLSILGLSKILMYEFGMII